MTPEAAAASAPTPASVVDLLDEAALADLGTFAARAKALDPQGAMRLLVVGDVLASYVCVVSPGSLTGAGTVLGLRTYAARADGSLDVTVPLAAITDRTMRRTAGRVLAVPPRERACPVGWHGGAEDRLE